MGLFDWLFGKKAAAPSRSGPYAIKAPRSNPRHKKMRHNPWKPCDDPAVELRRPSEYMGAKFDITRGRRRGKFKIVGCGVAPTKIRKYGGVRTGLYAAKYEDGQIRYLPKNWVASTYSRVQRAEAAKAAGVAPKSRKSAKAAPKPRKGARSSGGSLVGRGCKKVTFKPAGKKQVSFLSCPPGVRKLQLGASQFQGMLGLPAPRKPKKAAPKKAASKKAASRKPKKGTSGMVRMVDQFRALAAAARGQKAAAAAAAAKPKKAASRKPKKAAPKKAAPKKSRSRRSAPKPSMPGILRRPSTQKAPVFSPDDVDFGMGRVAKPSMPGILRRPIGFSARPARQPDSGSIFAPGGVEVIPVSMVSGMGGGRFSSSPMSTRSMGGAPSPFLLGPGSPAKKASKKRGKKGSAQPTLPLGNPSHRRRMSYLY